MDDIPVYSLKSYLPTDTEGFYISDFIPTETETTLHGHSFYEFYIVVRGQFEDICNGVKTVLNPKSAHILCPGDRHELRCSDFNTPALLRNIAVDPVIFGQRLSALTGENGKNKKLTEYFTLRDETFADFLVKSESALLQYPSRSSLFLLGNLLDSVLIERLALPDDTGAPPWLKKLLLQMRETDNFVEGLPKMLSLCGRSQEYLTRCMQKYYHITPNDFVQRLRLNYAAQLLRTSRESVLSITYRCGFSTPSYFCNAFRQRFGTSPAKFRERKLF